MPTATWSMPVAAQNGITRSCALSLVVVFAMATRAVGPRRASQGAVSTQLLPLALFHAIGHLPPFPFGRGNDASVAPTYFPSRPRGVDGEMDDSCGCTKGPGPRSGCLGRRTQFQHWLSLRMDQRYHLKERYFDLC